MARSSPARSQAETEAAAAAAAANPAGDPPADTPGPDAPAPAATPAAPPAKASAPAIDPVLERFMPAKVRGFLGLESPADDWKARLLAECCFAFGVDPNPKLKPRELMSHRFESGDPDAAPPVPASVTIVTCGGMKIRYPLDDDTEARLRVAFNAYRFNKKTGEREVLPLPADLTLDRPFVDGMVRSSEHQYRTGYLKEGGASEAARRAKLAELRTSGKLR